jgi:hypothetical protein
MAAAACAIDSSSPRSKGSASIPALGAPGVERESAHTLVPRSASARHSAAPIPPLAPTIAARSKEWFNIPLF